MPDFNRVVLTGYLASGDETWSTSCAFRSPGGATVFSPEDLNAWAFTISENLQVSATIPELLVGLSSQGGFSEVKCYHYPGTSSPATAVGQSELTRAGTTGGSRPITVAAVFSLRTGLAGRRRRGRMYWPAVSNTINTSGRFTSTVTANLASGAESLLNIIADAAPTAEEPVPVVVSRAGDFVTPVTSIAVGDVPDSMRSRRDGLIENYSTVAYTP